MAHARPYSTSSTRARTRSRGWTVSKRSANSMIPWALSCPPKGHAIERTLTPRLWVGAVNRKADESPLSRSSGQRNIPRFGVSAMEIGDELLHVVRIIRRGIPLTHQNDRLVQGGARTT